MNRALKDRQRHLSTGEIFCSAARMEEAPRWYARPAYGERKKRRQGAASFRPDSRGRRVCTAEALKQRRKLRLRATPRRVIAAGGRLDRLIAPLPQTAVSLGWLSLQLRFGASRAEEICPVILAQWNTLRGSLWGTYSDFPITLRCIHRRVL